MLTAVRASPPPPSAPGSTVGAHQDDPATPTGPDPVPASGNGDTDKTATLSLALEKEIQANGHTALHYVTDRIGNRPRWIRITLAEAHMWASSGYTILDGTTYEAVTSLPTATHANPSLPPLGDEQREAELVASELALERAQDEQYLAAEAAHGTPPPSNNNSSEGEGQY
ncbi:hypothetical protein BS50DRAFT_621007 [Corynespora cassiicola Philippines]|uniref:Uncharacterized protein n=1 Tax=Corynespora cassiicola Philippines TaxID=1448308 RepID=A0A2T2NN26_CORCC|nr:hypothetical protein BS50DRAFT_621007 [Corynespora cassiicola Philippines]